jgi:hypothetical protein
VQAAVFDLELPDLPGFGLKDSKLQLGERLASLRIESIPPMQSILLEKWSLRNFEAVFSSRPSISMPALSTSVRGHE